MPLVIDSGTLLINGTTVRLSGVQGEGGEQAHELVQYIAGRPLECQLADASGQYRCKLGDYDLAEAVVLNGAGAAAENAPERLRNAEEKARNAGRGIWRQ